jgi:hypothetical protein
MRMPSFALVAALALSASTTGCIQKTLINGQAAATRKASVVANTLGDPEVARVASMNSLVQSEGVHYLAPDNEDTLYMLARGWASYAFAFCEDDYEVAKEKGDQDKADYAKRRVRMAYDRSLKYGLELLNKKAEGFEAAKKNANTLKPWLEEKFKDKEDADLLFWVGYAWIARASFFVADDPALVGELFVGVGMIERSRALDPEFMDYGASTVLAAYYARSAQGPEFQQGAKLFEEIIAKTQRKSFTALYNYAARVLCGKSDRAGYEKIMKEILDAGDLDENRRLTNNLARIKAKRALSMEKMMDCGFDMSQPASK